MMKSKNSIYLLISLTLLSSSNFLVAKELDKGHIGIHSMIIQTDTIKYNPTMSSTVGVGLTLKNEIFLSTQINEFHWKTNFGHFLKWNPPHFKVVNLGKSHINNGEKIYWSYDPETKVKPVIEVDLVVKVLSTKQVINRSSINIFWDKSTGVTLKSQ